MAKKPTKSAAPIAPGSSTQGVKILTCACTSEYQDAKYGKYKRVHNLTPKSSTSGVAQQARCTVCTNVKTV